MKQSSRKDWITFARLTRSPHTLSRFKSKYLVGRSRTSITSRCFRRMPTGCLSARAEMGNGFSDGDTQLDLSQAKPPVVGRDISGETRNPSGFSGSKRVLSFL